MGIPLNRSAKVFRGTNLDPMARDIIDFIKSISAKQKQSLTVLWRRKMTLLIRDLANGTPAYTGAAAGMTKNAKVNSIPKWHPAYGMEIGNSPGDSGWQLYSTTTQKGFAYSIVNPMWSKYLIYVNSFGIHAGFVDRIWEQFKQEQGF